VLGVFLTLSLIGVASDDGAPSLITNWVNFDLNDVFNEGS